MRWTNKAMKYSYKLTKINANNSETFNNKKTDLEYFKEYKKAIECIKKWKQLSLDNSADFKNNLLLKVSELFELI